MVVILGKKLSIIIPCFNEARHLSKCLDSLLDCGLEAKDYEILVVDGSSTDGTREIALDYAARHLCVRVIDNPGKIKPIALNLGIKEAVGDVIMRIDAHANYSKGYVTGLLGGLSESGAENYGGIRKTAVEDGSAAQMAAAIAVSHPLTAGNALYRTGRVKRVTSVDTVFCGCYPRRVFDEIGMFNERLIRAQDREFNARLVGTGGEILLDPSIECIYYPRTRFWSYVSWIYEGAFWLFYARRFSEIRMVKWRNFLPSIFLLYLITGVLLILGSPPLIRVAFVASLLVYVFVLCGAGASLANRYGKAGLIVWFPIIALATHVSYGGGVLVGWASAVFYRFRDRFVVRKN